MIDITYVTTILPSELVNRVSEYAANGEITFDQALEELICDGLGGPPTPRRSDAGYAFGVTEPLPDGLTLTGDPDAVATKATYSFATPPPPGTFLDTATGAITIKGRDE